MLQFIHFSKIFHRVIVYLYWWLADDPYYCGLRARIPNFAKSKAQKEKEATKYAVTQQQQTISPPSALPGQVPPHHPMMWHRGYLDNGKLVAKAYNTLYFKAWLNKYRRIV